MPGPTGQSHGEGKGQDRQGAWRRDPSSKGQGQGTRRSEAWREDDNDKGCGRFSDNPRAKRRLDRGQRDWLPATGIAREQATRGYANEYDALQAARGQANNSTGGRPYKWSP